jgi:predicted nucleic acid-binding protein
MDRFKGHPNEALDEALIEGTAVVPALVVAEIFSGVTTAEQRIAIGEFLQETPMHPTSLGHWMAVGELRQELRRKGVSVSLPDAHIAQCALELDALLLTRDDIFPLIARHTSLRVTSAAS